MILHEHEFVVSAIFAVLLIALRSIPWKPDELRWGGCTLGLALMMAVVAVAGPILTVVGHLSIHDEPSFVSIALANAHGQPLYHAPLASERYALLYGPMAYWLYLLPMLAGARMQLVESWPIAPLLVSMLVLWRVSRLSGSKWARALVLLQAATSVISMSAFLWSVRGDVWLLCFAAVGMYAAVFLEGFPALALIAVCGAALIDIKFTTVPVALLPVLYVVEGNRRWGRAASCVGAMFVLAASAFLLPGVSAANYVYWLRASAQHGLSLTLVGTNLLSAVFRLFVPVVIVSANRGAANLLWAEHKLWITGVMVATGCAAMTGAKHGAGAWHLALLVPAYALVTALLLRRVSEGSSGMATAAWTMALFAAVFLIGLKDLRVSLVLRLHGRQLALPAMQSAIAADLREVVREHPGQEVEMGFGGDATYELTFQRPILVALGNRYRLDPPALDDMELAGLPLPTATTTEITACRTQVWLIPAGDAPFTMTNFYAESLPKVPRETFPKDFREAFLAAYHVTGRSKYFDLWTCQH